jgi:hypothetical protein
MARTLSFTYKGADFQVPINKVDRKKVYGWVDRKAIDRDGNECFFGSISGDGLNIFGRESFEMGHVDDNGDWVEKGNLKVVDLDGDVLEKQDASFKSTIELAEVVSVDEYLNHTAKSVYQIDDPGGLLETVREAGIFKFTFNYVASYQPDPAFLVENDGVLFMVVGEDAGFEFIGLAEVENTVLVEDEEEESSDELDFSMF